MGRREDILGLTLGEILERTQGDLERLGDIQVCAALDGRREVSQRADMAMATVYRGHKLAADLADHLLTTWGVTYLPDESPGGD